MDSETTKKSESVKPKTTFLKKVNDEQYQTLLQLAQGNFKIPKPQQTQQQKNAVRQYQRRKGDFSINSGMLYFQGRQVMTSNHVTKMVKKTLKKNMGSGGRSTWLQIRGLRAGVSYDTVQGMLRKSRVYTKHRPLFRNKVPPKAITSSFVNERWQIDLINMTKDAVFYNGKAQNYILSIVDTFSRFLLLRPLPRKRSDYVAETLERVFAEHGVPKIIQCDRGTEFQGEVLKLLQRRNIKLIKSSPYHPQSQGKCERSHREVRDKINFKLKSQQSGFNWARNLFEVQEAINNIPKEVLGNRTPGEVYANRGNAAMCEQVRRASDNSQQRTARNIARRIRTSVYRRGEKILIRYPPRGGGKIVPRRRYTCQGVIEDRRLTQNKYKVKFVKPDGNEICQWISVTDITSITAKKEKLAGKRILTEEIKKDQNQKYHIPITHNDRIQHLQNAKIKVLFDPKETVGSCQFHSVSHQLSLFGIHRTPQHLRQEAVEHIRELPATYNDFIVGDPTLYINEMRKESTYGDHVTLLALSRLYNVQFLIASADGPEHTILISPDDDYSEDVFLLTLGYFPEGRGEHYVSIGIDNQTKAVLLSYVNQDGGNFHNFNEEADRQNCTQEGGGIEQGEQGEQNVERRGEDEQEERREQVQAERGEQNVERRGEDEQEERREQVQAERGEQNVERRGEDEQEERREQVQAERGEQNVERRGEDEQEERREQVQAERGEQNVERRGEDEQEGRRKQEQEERREQVQTERGVENQGEQGEQEQVERRKRDEGEQREQEQMEQGEREEGEQREQEHMEQGERDEGEQREQEHMEQGERDEREQREQEQEERGEQEFLPREIQIMIIHRVMQISPASRFTLRLVNTFFQEVIAAFPLPMLHIDYFVLQYIPRPVSVRRISLAAGRGSGLVREIRRMLASPRWFNAWLWLREGEHRQFEVTHVWYRVGWP